MSSTPRPSGRGNINEPVLPCEDLDVEVVSDIIEESADIEVEAKAEDNPDPDLDIVATVEDSAAVAANQAAPGSSPDSSPPPEPDYDVEVQVAIQEEGPPDMQITCEVGRSTVAAQQAQPQPSPTSDEEAASPSGSPPIPEPDYDVDVSVEVIDAGEPDLELTCVVTGDSNESTKGTESHA